MAYRQIWGPDHYRWAAWNGCVNAGHTNPLCEACEARLAQDLQNLKVIPPEAQRGAQTKAQHPIG